LPAARARGDDLGRGAERTHQEPGFAQPHNVVKATFDALVQLRDRAEVANMRGKSG